MFITGLGTASPPQCYSQKECWDTLLKSKKFYELETRSRAILKKVLTSDNGIATRHLALDDLNEAFDLTPDALHARFAKYAPMLASTAAEKALSDAGVRPEDIGALIISTCTGYLCPGLTSYVSERLKLRPDATLLDLVGQGCAAAVPNLRTAEALLTAGKCHHVLSICVEVCSAALFFDNDPGVLISACLFGDGAGAAVLANEPAADRRIEWQTSGSWLEPADRDLLRFEQKDGMLRNRLAQQVPMLAARYAEKVLSGALAKADLPRSQVAGWVFHPGGRDVLLALRQELGLSATDLRWSESVLREYGNLSSASLYFVLKSAFADSAPNGRWWMSSFGAGFSCHGALLQVET
ncbi:MAG: stilbene synthase [Verrucomicrobia bacterium]|nr:MAG: stilbene synthase [Verrucomicrobiota bacterium]